MSIKGKVRIFGTYEELAAALMPRQPRGINPEQEVARRGETIAKEWLSIIRRRLISARQEQKKIRRKSL